MAVKKQRSALIYSTFHGRPIFTEVRVLRRAEPAEEQVTGIASSEEPVDGEGLGDDEIELRQFAVPEVGAEVEPDNFLFCGDGGG